MKMIGFTSMSFCALFSHATVMFVQWFRSECLQPKVSNRDRKLHHGSVAAGQQHSKLPARALKSG